MFLNVGDVIKQICGCRKGIHAVVDSLFVCIQDVTIDTYI